MKVAGPRTCLGCGIEKPPEDFSARSPRCKPCRAAASRLRRAENRDAINARRRARRNYASESAKKRAGERANPEQYRAGYMRRAKKSRETISDGYVRRMMDIPAAVIPQSLVDVKRALLALKRELKRKKDGR